MAIPVSISATGLGDIIQALAEAGFQDRDVDDICIALKKLGSDRTKLAVLTGRDGVARTKRDKRKTKRQANDPHGIAR